MHYYYYYYYYYLFCIIILFTFILAAPCKCIISRAGLSHKCERQSFMLHNFQTTLYPSLFARVKFFPRQHKFWISWEDVFSSLIHTTLESNTLAVNSCIWKITLTVFFPRFNFFEKNYSLNSINNVPSMAMK